MSTSKKKSVQKKAGTNKEKDPSVESSISSSENSDENNINSLLSDQKRIGEIEYRKNVLKALKEAINENDKLRESYKVYRRWSISNILMFCLGFFGGLLGIIRSQISMKYNIKLNEAQPLIEEKQKSTTKSSIFFLQRSSIMSKSQYSNVLSMDSLGDNYF